MKDDGQEDRGPSAVREPAVIVRGVTKAYGDIQALAGIDIDIEPATVFALLGPNGAGKTTLVRILTTLIDMDDGEARVAGHDVRREGTRLRGAVGLAGQSAAVDPVLTGRENLELVARLYHMPGSKARDRARDLLSQFDLVESADRQVRTYSGGMRRRLDVAASLVAEPEVLFLDEPSAGLDPRGRLDLWQVIRELVRGGTTVLLTTQYMEEADQLADRIAVIDRGRLIAEGTPAELKSRSGGEVLTVRAADDACLPEVQRVLGAHGDDTPVVDSEHGRVSVRVSDGAGLLAGVVRALDDAGVALSEIGLRQPTLDEVFLALTGRRAEDGAESNDDGAKSAPAAVNRPGGP